MASITVYTKDELESALKEGYDSINVKGELAEQMEKQQKSPLISGVTAVTGTDIFGLVIKFLTQLFATASDFMKDYVIKKNPNGGYTFDRKANWTSILTIC